MKQYLMVRQSDTVIVGCSWQDDPNDGPSFRPAPTLMEGIELVLWPDSFSRSGYSDDYVAKLVDGAVVWAPSVSLETLKAAKNDEINAARYAANQTYFEFNGKQIACDSVSMLDIQSANAEIALTRQMPSTWPGGWKTIDNSYVAITDVATWTLFIQAMVARGTVHFQHAQSLKQLLAAATTPEAVAGITWGMTL